MNRHDHYNHSYKRMLILARALNAPDAMEVFELAGEYVTKSQLQAWQVGPQHKHYRPISEEMLLAFMEGLIQWEKSRQSANAR